MILFFGPTGAGKSVQGQMMAVRHGWKWLSTGQMLRESTDPTIQQLLRSGELVSDEQTYTVFDQAIREAKQKNFSQIIVDGFPRTHAQADWLGEHMQEHNQQIDLVVVFEVPQQEIMKRLDIRAREEDTPEVIEKRLTTYRQKMYPVLGAFAEQNIKIVHLDGTGTVGQIHDRIETELAACHLV